MHILKKYNKRSSFKPEKVTIPYNERNIHRKAILVFLLAGMLSLTAACRYSGSGNTASKAENGQQQSIDSSVVQQEEIFSVTREDSRVISESPVKWDLSAMTSPLVITEGGDYLLTGNSDSTILIRTEDQNVHLFLEGVQIETNEGSAIQVESAGKLLITLVEGSSNVLADSARYAAGSASKAAIYSVCDLTINGSGKLSVYGYHEDAVYSKDKLKVLGGDYFIQAKGDALRGSDGVLLQPDKLEIEAERSGIRTVNSGKENKGTISLEAGDVSIIAGKYGMEAAQDLYIMNCELYLKTVVSDYQVEGNSYIDERCLSDE